MPRERSLSDGKLLAFFDCLYPGYNLPQIPSDLILSWIVFANGSGENRTASVSVRLMLYDEPQGSCRRRARISVMNRDSGI